jgi:DNA sulfur modification protein DndB
MEPTFGYQFPAIKGIMSGRPYFASMCPMRLIPRIFLFDEDEAALPPEMRAQRTINKSRIPEMSDYIVSNPEGYVFSSITASIDGEILFTPISKKGQGSKIGTLAVSMDSKFIINDGQHRRAAIEAALKEKPELGDESIAIVFFIDRGLERCQQMFADLNRYAIRTSSSIGLLYDHRDDMAKLARLVVMKSALLSELTEMEKSTLARRSRKLFTFSALYRSMKSLLHNLPVSGEECLDLSVEFWETLADVFPEWQAVFDRKYTSGEIRKQYLHPHAIALQSLGKAGNALLTKYPKRWKSKLKLLGNLDWNRSNLDQWEGRAMVNGRLSKANQHVILTSNLLKQTMGLPLTEEECKYEAERKESTLVAT